MPDQRGIILPPYKASFAARLPVGGVMQMRVPIRFRQGENATWLDSIVPECHVTSVPTVRDFRCGESSVREVAGGTTFICGGDSAAWEGFISTAPLQPGDAVFGKERWCSCYHDAEDGDVCTGDVAIHQAGYEEDDGDEVDWQPATRMPRWAARLFFRVRSVRVERLQDISFSDARAEGCDPAYEEHIDNCDHKDCGGWHYGETWHFARLWDSHHKRHPWQSNPFCWVYELERTERT